MKKIKTLPTIALAVILAITTFLIAMPFISAQTDFNGYCGGMMAGFYGGYGTGAMLLWWIIGILIIILIVAAIYWLIKSANKRR